VASPSRASWRFVAECGPIFLAQRIVAALRRRAAGVWSTVGFRLSRSRGEAIPRCLGLVYVSNPSHCEFGTGCEVGTDCFFTSETNEGRLKFGRQVKINDHVKLDYSGGLTLADNVLISSDVLVLTHSHGDNPRSIPVAKPLRIGENTWIGTRAIITESVRSIGCNVIVASGAVVTKDVPDDSVVGGIPAKLIRKRQV
jgi:acetyltransferase-like isoleucine patch superfamily enzyme